MNWYSNECDCVFQICDNATFKSKFCINLNRIGISASERSFQSQAQNRIFESIKRKRNPNDGLVKHENEEKKNSKNKFRIKSISSWMSHILVYNLWPQKIIYVMKNTQILSSPKNNLTADKKHDVPRERQWATTINSQLLRAAHQQMPKSVVVRCSAAWFQRESSSRSPRRYHCLSSSRSCLKKVN